MGATRAWWATIRRYVGPFGFALLIAGPLGCSGARAGAPPAPSVAAATVSSGAPSTAPVAWKTMNKSERSRYMKDVVVPRMADLFRSFDGKAFANFDCSTCHGPGAVEGSFSMPNPALPALPGNAAGFQALLHDKPEWMRFMGRQVRPQMAALLGMAEVDMRNPKPDAFGCRNCHAMPQR